MRRVVGLLAAVVTALGMTPFAASAAGPASLAVGPASLAAAGPASLAAAGPASAVAGAHGATPALAAARVLAEARVLAAGPDLSASKAPAVDSAHAAPKAPAALPARVAGSSRWGTAALLATRFGAATTVVIANGTDAKGGFDALAANYLAGVVGAPILLTSATVLAPEAEAAIKAAMQAAGGRSFQVLVMGKADSVSDAVVNRLNAVVQSIVKDKLNHVVRVSGDSRYDTAVAAATLGGDDLIGQAVGAFSIGVGSSSGKTAFLASGTANADALAAGPISNALRIPVYLTSSAGLPDSVATVIASQGIRNLIVLGGSDRVPEAVVAQAQAAGVVSVKRIAGSNRYGTAADLYNFARGALTAANGAHYGTASYAPVFLANGNTGFPDALAVGPLAAKLGATLLTTSVGRLEPAARQYLQQHVNSVASVTALGSPSTVAETVLASAQAAASK